MKRLAIVGCGGIGSYHLEHFLQYKDVELAGFCDIIPERANDFAEKAGGSAFTCYKEMYDTVKPDMVFVCVPPTEHGDIEFEAIKRGIHLFVEKPVSLDMGLARKIRDAAEKAGIVTASGFQCRYSSLAGPTKRFTAENEVVFVGCARMGGIPGTPWWKKRATSGGQIVEQTIHQYDLIRYAMGEPDTVFTMGARGFNKGVEGYDTEDVSVTCVRFRSGALASIATGCYATAGAAWESKITFGARDARLDHYLLTKVDVYREVPAEETSSGFVVKGDGALGSSESHVVYTEEGDAGTLCDRTFVDAAISGDASKIRSPYADAVRSLAFTLACNKSMDTGLPVKVEL